VRVKIKFFINLFFYKNENQKNRYKPSSRHGLDYGVEPLSPMKGDL